MTCGHGITLDPSMLSNLDSSTKETDLRGQLSTRLKVTTELLATLSHTHSIPLCLCEECATELQGSLEQKVEEKRKELEFYKSQIQTVVNVGSSSPTKESREQIQQRFDRYH
jgi:hypothetical protein